MEQQGEPAGVEPGEGEVAGAPPDPAPIVEILPLVEAPAEEEGHPGSHDRHSRCRRPSS